MPPNPTLRGRFTQEGLTTASGPRIVVMCFDRLDRDLSEAIAALAAEDKARAHDLLCHAQEIVHELLCMLDLQAWEHAPRLASIYRYVMELLTRSNVKKSAGEAIEARGLMAELAEAFREALIARPVATEQVVASTQFSVRA
ncbi:MAG: flagellar biosynthesis protein FliS [Acidimicrobiales bacterium]|nr:flagellar biosynthesis protein FliS [Acidimicrobiales bacterium]